jgi:membrane protease YdiL (CAAX protease family)
MPDPDSDDLGAIPPIVPEPEELPSTDAAAVEPPLVALPPPEGPGLFESLLWIAGMLVVQVGAAAAAVAVLVVLHVLPSGRPLNPGEARNVFEQNLGTIIGVAHLAVLAYCLAAVAWRLRPHGLLRLGLQLPSGLHLFLIAALTVPLALTCTPLQSWILQQFPGSDGGLIEGLKQLASAPLGVLLVLIALGPALTEELMFRGLIGHGLIARWGLLRGVAITSILFGAMHLNPAQGLAVIPLGVAMHGVYLATRSIWAPVALHFMNNGFAVLALKYGPQIVGKELAKDDPEFSPVLFAMSASAVAVVATLIWLTRVRSLAIPNADSGECQPAA